MAQRMVSCPRCSTRVEWSSENPWRPFCSEHCKMIDLGAWASERYRIPVVDHEDLDGCDVSDNPDSPALN